MRLETRLRRTRLLIEEVGKSQSKRRRLPNPFPSQYIGLVRAGEDRGADSHKRALCAFLKGSGRNWKRKNEQPTTALEV
jgi:hypothetical protein